MKNSHKCPKCGCEDIIFVNGQYGSYYRGNVITPHPYSSVKYFLVDRYVCGNCGYSEEWILEKDLEELKKCCK